MFPYKWIGSCLEIHALPPLPLAALNLPRLIRIFIGWVDIKNTHEIPGQKCKTTSDSRLKFLEKRKILV